MKRILIVISLLFTLSIVDAQQVLSPYYKVADFDEPMDQVAQKVKEAITAGGYEVIGEYHPAENANLMVICYTSKALEAMSLEFKDRGALASVLRAGLVNENGKVTLTILNPEYMFTAYWGEQMERRQETEVTAMSDHALAVFKPLGKMEPMGGRLLKEDLPRYHYKMMMPYFDDPVELREFDSFESGLSIIRANLNAGKGNTIKVFEQVFPDQKVAVFGVGLYDSEEGEAHFLPIIGEGHIANLPYEIILQDNEATMLAGKYRIALYWPELTMGTFMKIMSTPGDIENAMEAVCE